MRYLVLCVTLLFGCSKPYDSADALKELEESMQPPSAETQAAALIELTALRNGMAGGITQQTKRRMLFLEEVSSGEFALWGDSNSTWEDCVDLAWEMRALAAGSVDIADKSVINERITHLQGLLKQAGYDFDDEGQEIIFDADGKKKPGYEPLEVP